jgi:antitoxin component YwqK of YwqJK toxin-antitoxin module
MNQTDPLPPGKEDGLLIEYSEDGTIEHRETFKDGELVDKRVYD